MTHSHSQTEQNYLKALFNLSVFFTDGIPTNAIAETMKTKPSSVTDMIKRLSDKNLVLYTRYQGVKLSKSGKKEALSIIRKHRLWETFLVKKLGFKWDEVHDIAEQLEHIESEKLIQKIDSFLGYPKTDPHGDPIPDKKGNFKRNTHPLLKDTALSKKVFMSGVVIHSSEFLKYLDKNGLNLGCKLEVLERNSFDNSHHIKVNGKKKIIISNEVASNILVEELK
jgi:DtxR family Mn-dependent transcriptional regulator